MKKGYVANLEQVTTENNDYRRIIYTGEHSQLVVMSLEPGVQIGEETHHLDQFIRIEKGIVEVILNETEVHTLTDDWCVIIPAGTKHNVINRSDKPVKLYSIYSPAEHKDGLIQATKADEEEVHFDGETTE